MPGYPNLGWFIEALLLNDPKHAALVERTRYRRFPITFRSLRDKVRKCRVLLRQLGAQQGDRLILWGPNSSDWVAVLFAGLQSGLVVVPVDLQAPEELVARIVEQTGARLLFTHRPRERAIQTILFQEMASLLEPLAAEEAPIANVERDALAEIVYTSGTTGVPKGVMLQHGNILSNLEAIEKTVLVPFPLRIVSTLPLSHMLEQVVGLFFLLGKGSTIIYPDTLRPTRLARIIRFERAHGMMTVPGMLQSLRAYCERVGRPAWRIFGWRLRLLGTGGAALAEDLERWWSSSGVMVVQGYGLTETASALASNSIGHRRIGSIGRPLPGVRVKLGEDGEILAQGPNVFPGYYEMPEKTAEQFTPDHWFKTGDIGELRNGDIYFKGRKKDVIVTSSGLNVYPEDIEHVLDSVAGVKESCVIERNDKVWAVLCLGGEATAENAVKAANARLGSHQQIMGASVWPEPSLPRTALGKIRKFEVRRKLDEKESGRTDGAAPVYKSKLELLLARLSGVQSPPADKKLAEIGIDSLRRVELLSALEEDFGVELEETALTAETTVGELEALASHPRADDRSDLSSWQFGPVAEFIRSPLQPLVLRTIDFWANTRVFGLEYLEDLSLPVIFVANHQSAWDGAIVAGIIPKRFHPIAMPALPDFFGMPPQATFVASAGWQLMGLAIRLAFRCYPFGPAAGMERCFELTGRRLDAGDNILIFPEGGRTPDGRIQPFFGGIGILAREMRAAVVPVRIEGLHEIMPYPRFVFPKGRGSSRVIFGAPLSLPEDISPDQAAKLIQEAVEKLA